MMYPRTPARAWTGLGARCWNDVNVLAPVMLLPFKTTYRRLDGTWAAAQTIEQWGKPHFGTTTRLSG